MSKLISVGQLMREFGQSSISQREFLRTMGVKSAIAKPYGRGYSHFVTPEDGERMRARLSAKKPNQVKSKPADQQPPTQIHFDNIETKESVWSRFRNALQVFAGK